MAIAISEDTIQLCWELHEAMWEHLTETLSRQALDQVRDYEALHLYANIASGRLVVNDFGREDAPRSLVDVLASVLGWLPRKHWPDRLEMYAEHAPLALEALQVYAWKAGIEDRRPPIDEDPLDLEQLAASVIAEDDAACNAFVKRARLMMEGMKPSAQFEIIAEANERALAERPDLDDVYRAEVEGRIAQARRMAAELKEQGR